jgi:LmbE family N-acetylglucosaminyl deacetylase
MRAFVYDIAARPGATVRPLRNRAFRTRLRVAADAPTVILSPHPDDAVLSCWSVLAAPVPLHVVNVFAGVPPTRPAGHFERLAGAHDSAAHMRGRIAEDRAALAHAGRTPVNLAFRCLSHRNGRPEPSFARVDGALAAQVGAVSRVYAPAALGASHPDHDVVRGYADALARQGVPVRLYADVPYCTVYGWPSWVTGSEPDPHLDVDAYWNGSAGAARTSADVVRLDADAAAAKLAAMRTYRSEFSVLDRGPVGQLSNPAVHGFEVFWEA